MKTIAIANQKGGTGKTTTTYNLGIALTQQGYRVLMVDFDPQGNLSCYCGIPPEKDLEQTITELLMKTSCEKPIGNRECVYQTGRKEAAARVDFIPSNLRLAGFELAMGTMMCREVLLNSATGPTAWRTAGRNHIYRGHVQQGDFRRTARAYAVYL